jgi:formylglycine-generating enzyme required for sulfatase activity
MIMNKMIKTVLLSFIGALVFSACPAEFFHPGEERTNNTSNSQTPVASDYNITGLSQVWDGSPKTVNITHKPGKSPGAITIYYNGSATAPSAAGSYAVTFNVAAAPDWKAASGLSAGTLVISGGDNAITFNSVAANGSSSQTTTEITLSFSAPINGLNAPDITLSGISGVTKGSLTGNNPYTLAISGFTTGGTLTVSVAKPGFTINGSPRTVTVYYTAVPANFVYIQGGTFTMGSPSNESGRDSDEVQHQVTLSAFYMGKYQVTQAEYEALMGTNPSSFKGSNLPVESVNWYDAVEFCNRLSQGEGLTPAYSGSGSSITCNWNANGYRLPTEAEWEYACRAGTTTPFSTGNNITTSQANYNGNYPYNNNAAGIYRETTTPVGSFASNPCGLYDMHGNVWEWCWDWYGIYSTGTQTNPRGPVSGVIRVIRGGSWLNVGQILRSAFRSDNYPSYGRDLIGFRLVRN